MDKIELNNVDEGREEERSEQDREREETSFSENTQSSYDNIRSRINSETTPQSKPNDENDITDLERRIQDNVDRKATQRFDAIQALESAMGTKLSVTHGDNSKELIDNISGARYSVKGNFVALKYKGEDVKLTAKGKINNAAKKQNKRILESIKKATEEYNKSLSSVIHETAGMNVSDEAELSIRENVDENLEQRIEEIRESIVETPPPKVRIPKPNVREQGTQAKPPETRKRKIQTKPPNVRALGTQAKPNAKEQETQANLPTIKPPKTKDQKTQIKPPKANKKETQTYPTDVIVDENLRREINGIMHTDDNVDYDELNSEDPDPAQTNQYNAKINGLKENITYFEDLERRETNPDRKFVYKSAKELCILKKSQMEVKAGIKPESEEALSMIQEEVEINDLTRFERFKRWAKENLLGVSAVAISVAISVAGIITTVVLSGRNAVKKGAKAVGEFGKALANLAKKAGPAIATILNVLAQVLTWGAKALTFLSKNLWIVALFLTYLVYDTVKERIKSKN